ncbi:uncharacterized protein LOC125723787 isoform X7 [Brienomyrus brachyistius]|uniref:uncharacterized protein LOC125723787 isoform X7 n=1 Tax=Brienomyrus brachyistius TaxID=42636 RepID=UPI0020B2166F|nr:uncharacterized protein LOC125723787 isoform X7 [Brienomyrus brachyistius]
MKIRSLVLALIFFGMVVSTDGFQLLGSAGPLTARLGGAVLLPCLADRPLPLEELEVDWRRTDSDTIVHLFQGAQSRPESQGDAYRGRAHFSQEIPKGNFSLLLEGVRTADAGVYKCVVYTEQEHHEKRVAIQQVERLVVTGADQAVYADAGEDVTLSCSVDTHVNVTELYVEWRKTDDDILVLLYDGEIRPESQPERYSGRAEFFIEEIPKGNFSMKLWKVRTEDNGDFMCEVHTNTDSANTTVRISPLGYSSLHWLILVLCFAVTPVVLITAFSLRHLKLPGECKQPVLYHCLYITVPSFMVFIAFILWGVTEGSTEEAVTCTAISLLNVLMLFHLMPKDLFTGIARTIKDRAHRLGSGIFIIYICTFAIIEFTTNYSTYTAVKVAFGYVVGVFIATMIFIVSLQVGYIFLQGNITLSTIKKVLGGIAVLLIIYISFATAVGVYLTKYFTDTVSKEMLTVLIVPMIVVLFPFVSCGIVLTCYIMKPAEEKRPKINYLFMCIPSFSYFMILTVYNQLITLVHNVFIPGYLLVIVIAPSLMFASFVVEVYMHSWRHFYASQRILLAILFPFHLIISAQYVNLTLEDDKERLVKLARYTFVYSSTIISFFDDWLRSCLLGRPRILLYWFGSVSLPLVNSIALAVVLILKADTGKRSLDLQVVVFFSASSILFSWFLIKITEYWMDRKQEIKQSFACLQRHQDNEPHEQICGPVHFLHPSHDDQEMEAFSPTDPNGTETGEGSHDDQEMEAFSPTDPNGTETGEVTWSGTDKSEGSEIQLTGFRSQVSSLPKIVA